MNRLKCVLLVVLFLLTTLSAVRADDITDAIEQGRVSFARGQYELAIEQYSRALTGYGDHITLAHYNIGVCHYRLGRLHEAIKHYRQAIQLRGGKYANASYALGMVLSELNRIAEA
ncbi:MAG TPA: tetratricopeptide repeat protein, partial [Blastocatellia bacterium]|nr:tetratricopeptide repeat protein [Blastocatellia bacterium]